MSASEEAPRRLTVTPLVEMATLAIAVAIGIGSYAVITGGEPQQRLIAPPLVALLLVANLVPGIALLVLLGRRIAMRRAALSPVGGRGRLHVRLVALFSVVAAVPMLLVTIFASLLFQYGVQFWYSDQARAMIENATKAARASYNDTSRRYAASADTAASDIARAMRGGLLDNPGFAPFFGQQIYFRGLSDGILFSVTPTGEYQSLAIVNPDLLDLTKVVRPADLKRVAQRKAAHVRIRPELVDVITAVPGFSNVYLYTASAVDLAPVAEQLRRGQAIEQSYRELISEARSLQLKFNAALLVISLLIVGFAVWIALALADRLVRPVGELVDAARRVEGGDLSARVPERQERDEVGTLATAFNAMTERLEGQNTALVTANAQLDSRRALIEAVMSGVSAGVVSIAPDRNVRLINASAERLLGLTASPVGQPLASVAPALDALLDGNAREAIVELRVLGEPRTLAVRIARDGSGPILTFDDITQQLLDQRRAAWSDVARRIAHEIKNPLTPIQLAAERLQRRYGGKVEEGDTTFARLTDTIVRQVGDLRRMVDEFSSFARMPKPQFRRENLADITQQAMFLHEVAHPGVSFRLEHAPNGPMLVCDRRQIGQALTNIVKNAVEAIEATERPGVVTMMLSEAGGRVVLTVADTGVGLPAERDRIAEPYMTTRARGTGLGLAIVKKIVEEHLGQMSFSDNPGGGTIVTLEFDAAALDALDGGAEHHENDDGGQLAALTRS